jgi:carboxypeptidase family protein
VVRFLSFFILIMILATVAFGAATVMVSEKPQTSTLSGRVTNRQGIGVRATVRVVNGESGEVYTARSNHLGYYRINNIPVGEYAIDVRSKGLIFLLPTVLVPISEDTRMDFRGDPAF